MVARCGAFPLSANSGWGSDHAVEGLLRRSGAEQLTALGSGDGFCSQKVFVVAEKIGIMISSILATSVYTFKLVLLPSFSAPSFEKLSCYD
jgi:hypothetical protein